MSFSNNLWKIKTFLRYAFSPASSSLHGWVKPLIDVLKQPLYVEKDLISIYAHLRKNPTPLIFKDPGSKGGYVHSTVKEIFRRTSKPYKEAFRLAHMAKFFRATWILELGGAFGTTTLVFKHFNPQSKVISVEGVPEIAVYAQKNTELYYPDVEIWNMFFHEALTKAQEKKLTFDFVFLDGHHEASATNYYLEKIRSLLADKAIVVVDDIHYNPAMYTWWKNFYLDIFPVKITTWDAGILIKNDNLPVENFRVKIFL